MTHRGHGRADRPPAGDRRERHARAAPARTRPDGAPRPRRHPRLAGRRPVRRARPLGRPDRRPRASSTVRRVRLDVLYNRLHPSIVTWNLVNEVQGNGIRHGQRTYVVRGAAGRPHARRRPPDRGRRLGHPPAGRARHDLQGGRRRRRHQLRGLVRRPLGSRARSSTRASAPGRAACTSCSRTRSWPSPSSAPRPTRSTRRASPAGWRFQADLLARHIRAYQADPHVTGMLAWSLQDFALRPNFLGGSVRAYAPALRLRRGHQRQGPVHLRRPPEAVRGDGPAAVRLRPRCHKIGGLAPSCH